MKGRTVYFHVGMQKTASSSIQKTLANNRELLCDLGYLYPYSWSDWHVKEIGTLCNKEEEEQRRNILHRRQLDEESIANIINKLNLEIIHSKCNNIVISAESTIRYSYEGLRYLKKKLFEDLNISCVKVILITREPVSFARSYVQAKIKAGFQQSTYLNKKDFKHAEQIKNILNVFGKENVILYSFEESVVFEYGPTGFFLASLCVPNNYLDKFKYYKSNESVSGAACSIIDFINNKEPLIINNKINPKRKLGDTRHLYKLTGGSFELSKENQEQVLKWTDEYRDWLKKEFGIDYLAKKTADTNSVLKENIDLDDLLICYQKCTKEIQNLIKRYMLERMKIKMSFRQYWNTLVFLYKINWS